MPKLAPDQVPCYRLHRQCSQAIVTLSGRDTLLGPEGILSDEFLSRVAALEQKNLALGTLRKLLAHQTKATERTNRVQSRKFRKALEKAMLGYTSKQIGTASTSSPRRATTHPTRSHPAHPPTCVPTRNPPTTAPYVRPIRCSTLTSTTLLAR